ncbi:MAG: hypothetical protein DRR19_11380 [Candidatus Parabeggiatoa sp. nov. 1]|nr:MAG: hypothetical protein DRR19_11380 [Gammaproteobacteria bacterium]
MSPREQHFVALKSKYQVSDYPDSSPTSPLYFLLRKIDLGLELIELELDWLKQPELQQLHRQLLDLQAPRQTAITELTTEFANLKSKYDAQSSSVISWEKTPFYLMLYKLDSGTQLTDSELKWLRDNRFFQTIAFSQKIRYFARLKAKYKATQHPNSSLSSHLYPILKALETNKRLNETEVNWLKCHKLVDTLAIFQQQESVLEAQFAKLKAKYQATQHPESSVSSPLYQILQNFEADKPLSESELNWLTEHQLTETFGLAQEIKPKRHFAELKRQYQATQSEESSPKSHLYKVLKRLDSDNVLTESDINFLKKRKLTETMAIAVKKYAASLKSKAASASTLLSKAEIDWLKQNGHENIFTFAIDNYATILASNIESENPSNRADMLAWLKLMGRKDIITFLQELKHFVSLKSQYDVSWYQEKSPPRSSQLYAILKKLDNEKRLKPEEFAWLEGEKLFKRESKIFITYHEIEATFYEQESERTGNQWNLANASSHWRSAEQPESALKLTDNLNFGKVKGGNRLKSALSNTRGGAFRDLGEFDNAERCALKAMKYCPESHYPYTLLGALCYATGRYGLGDEYFDKAVKRGASPRDKDAEIKRVIKNASKEERNKIMTYLLNKDAAQYHWVKKYILDLEKRDLEKKKSKT